MKKFFKGFTLIELIIVMALMSILMLAMMQMFKPIRETFVDSTSYESQRSVQNGAVKYITESVRFSTDMGIYTKGQSTSGTNITEVSAIGSVVDAVEAFAQVYLKANGVVPADSNYDDNVDEIKKYAEVIIIDMRANKYSLNNQNFTGRILRRKDIGNLVLTAAEAAGSNQCRLALGAPYYGESDYTIKVTDPDPGTDWTAGEGIKVTVSSSNNRGTMIDNGGLVVCKNLELGGVFDTSCYDETSSGSTMVYIVYLNDKIDIIPAAP